MGHDNEQVSKSKKYDFERIESMIENGFMHDWAVTIQYAVRTEQNYTKWLKWDKTFFAINSSKQIMETLKECCRNNPECSMKLVCERFSPECRLVYCIHKQNGSS